MSQPENNPSLHELRRKWDEGHFRQDADSVYGIDEAVEEAIAQLLVDDNYDSPFSVSFSISPELSRGRIPSIEEAQNFARDAMFKIYGQFGNKTCRICRLTATNDPCDNCYSRFRRASQIPSEAGICVFCRNKSPSVICVPCTERILRDGLG
ncbi:hypothetical protein LCGC14_2344190 [marine sediment metagenome]|uniref:Uncharacterized protein n=1 Tax=marine sediment metagenome TaxID=412755 RepID=A0A0F9CBX2_9ZZZZ